jgi:hypothetical protein
MTPATLLSSTGNGKWKGMILIRCVLPDFRTGCRSSEVYGSPEYEKHHSSRLQRVLEENQKECFALELGAL